jgi:hypothetical protein
MNTLKALNIKARGPCPDQQATHPLLATVYTPKSKKEINAKQDISIAQDEEERKKPNLSAKAASTT